MRAARDDHTAQSGTAVATVASEMAAAAKVVALIVTVIDDENRCTGISDGTSVGSMIQLSKR